MGPSMIVFAPGLVNPTAPVYSDWAKVEDVVNAHQGAVRIIADSTGIPGGFMHIPSTANLDGQGRLEIVGGGPNGEAEIVMDDGAQIRNVREFRDIVFRAEPTIRVPLVWDIDGLFVECFDATFLFNGPGATLPVMKLAVPSYMIMYFYLSSELRNSHNPGAPVLDVGAGVTFLWSITNLVFASSFDTTVSGPASASIQVQVDASLPPTFSWPAFLGAVSVVQIDAAIGVTYTPTVVANWNNVAPANVQEALDRIAAKIGPIT